MNKFYVYLYLDDNNEPYYVGKGNGRRAYTKGKHEPIKKPEDKSRIRFIKENLSEDDAYLWEVFWISEFGRKDLGLGSLLNRSDGGPSTKGLKATKETKNTLSAAHKGKKKSPEHVAAVVASVTGKAHPQIPVSCLCGKTGALNNMKRYHLENCTHV
jgi:hypothetical protein